MKLYEMKCGETCYEQSSRSNIIRVPGGWIYQFRSDKTEDVVAQSFVPFNNEFQLAFDDDEGAQQSFVELPSTDVQQLKREMEKFTSTNKQMVTALNDIRAIVFGRGDSVTKVQKVQDRITQCLT